MQDRLIQFARGLRAAGVRVSISETIDAMRALEIIGVQGKDTFRESMRATLVKDFDDIPIFEELFPLYFGSDGPPMQNAFEELNADEQDMLEAALEAMSGRL